MDIQSVINIVEYLHVSNFVSKQKRRLSEIEYGTIKLYKARLLYLGSEEPPLKSLLIKDNILQRSVFGPPRPVLDYLPTVYIYEQGGNTFVQLGLKQSDPIVRLNGYLGPWTALENHFDASNKFLLENDFIASDTRRMGKLSYEELETTFQGLIKQDLDPRYLENLGKYMIQVFKILKIKERGIYVERSSSF